MCRKSVYVLSLVAVLNPVGKAPAQDADLLIRSPDVAMPVLDGVVDEVWSLSTEQSITTTLVGSEPGSPADCSGTWRALWNWEYLYVLVDVKDDALVQDSDPTQGWNDDRIEIFIDGENNKTTSTDDKRFGWISRYANMCIKAK
ncbi:MAG TPA: sugar-binding protein [Sedimentisphaerales bacterium]|nr:sugar-binding protein [Sedimentisphaerales bacterium]